MALAQYLLLSVFVIYCYRNTINQEDAKLELGARSKPKELLIAINSDFDKEAGRR
jgi:hypothetical protein